MLVCDRVPRQPTAKSKLSPMTRLQVPNTPAELTPTWLTAALAETGVVRDGAVSGAEWERVGQGYGFTGLVGRLRLHYGRAGSVAPASMVVKLPMAESDDRSGYRARQEREPALAQRANSGGLVFVDEFAEKVAAA